ncbi:response regulator [Paracoccus siganidrum]|uniref:DNA-binding response regulator n=1 Tax=Paracoccus siganidrum TaxID=1276757 RepID=A0A419A117_9RHOB|nr:response regulator transcription factor [Paracoccus siganidrum]RJL06594.1 DNA-binding response regulator [Paracoccus siganidrum]RMC34615.1 DNA-binding response regulator [Paracoccus siganidrum]
MIRVLIVDDHSIFRRGLAMALAEAGDLQVCGEGGTADEAVDLAQELQPDVVLLDLSMPGGGLNALRRIHDRQPDLAVAVLTASEDGEDVLEALRHGARGYVLKGVGSRSLIEAVRDLARGEGYVAPTLAARILTEMRIEAAAAPTPDAAAPASLLAQLTPREEEVLELVAAGYSNKEIARQKDMQEKTVKHHMSRILQKLHVRNRTEAAMVLRQDQKRG